MLGHSAISESSLSDSGTLVVIYTNLYNFVVYISKQVELDLLVKRIESCNMEIRKIEYVV